MVKAHTFLMPDYYPHFKCKMGACRHACCEGWRVTLSLNDYFRLESEDCSLELREKIDKGIKISLTPSPDAYAYIQHDYFGKCPMRLDDGRCALHAELGEKALAQVCRLYPRGIRVFPDYECSCANSCEAVLEYLFDRDSSIEFIKQEMELELLEEVNNSVNFGTQGREQAIRLWLIKILQNRKFSLANRLMNVGWALGLMDSCIENKNFSAIDKILSEPFIMVKNHFEVDKGHLLFGIDTMEKLLSIIDRGSDSIREYGEQALAYFGNDEMTFDKYEQALKKFETTFPKWEIWFEHMLVNHVFFEQFPFQDRPLGLWEEYVGISAVYSLLRFLGIGYMTNKERKEDFVDVSSAVFRLVDHTDFDRFASQVLSDLNCNSPQKISDLIML